VIDIKKCNGTANQKYKTQNYFCLWYPSLFQKDFEINT
jgi:hypothetical protein